MKKLFTYCFIAVFSLFFILSNWASALTVDEIIRLKKAGVSDETIRMLMELEQEKMQDSKKPSHNHTEKMGTWNVKDPSGKEVTIYTTGTEKSGEEDDAGDIEAEKREKAWEMLQNLVIDGRNNE